MKKIKISRNIKLRTIAILTLFFTGCASVQSKSMLAAIPLIISIALTIDTVGEMLIDDKGGSL